MSSVLRLALVPGLAAFFVACAAPTPQSRIAKHPEDFARLSARHQSIVQSGRIERGMPKHAVYFAWGSPDRVGEWMRNGVSLERWTYFGYEPVYRHTIGFGVGYGRWHGCNYADPFYHGGYDIDYIPYPARTVDFRAGNVVDWEARVR